MHFLLWITYLLHASRFDNIHTRNKQTQIDNLVPIRMIFDKFVNHCTSFNTTPGEYCTIDEMLEGFWGKCKYHQYIANKFNKYWYKDFLLW